MESICGYAGMVLDIVRVSECCGRTLAVVLMAHHRAAADDAPHGVSVVDAAHEQLSLQEQPRGRVVDLLGVHEPRPMEPWVPTEGGRINFSMGPHRGHVNMCIWLTWHLSTCAQFLQ